MQAVRMALEKSGIPRKTANIIMSAWRTGTSKSYNTYIRQWIVFCTERKQDPFQPTVVSLLRFLTQLFEQGKSYSSLNIARSAVATLSLGSENISANPLVSKFLRGVFHRRPSLPKSYVTWDADIVLIFF